MNGKLTLCAGIWIAAAIMPLAQGQTQPSMYAADLVSTTANGVAMNGAGDVAGVAIAGACPSQCLPVQTAVVWSGGKKLVLPTLPNRSTLAVSGMNTAGWVVGSATGAGTFFSHAVVWKPVNGSYQATDLGTLPNTTISAAVGIDDTNRVIGYSTTQFFPPNFNVFEWTPTTGMFSLTTAGFPNETPLAVSPGGTVATPNFWYKMDNLGSVAAIAAGPQGFRGPGAGATAINDNGNLTRFLGTTSSSSLSYLFRYKAAGKTWQLLSAAGTGSRLPSGVGSIDNADNVTGTIQGAGVIAYGPNGTAQALAGKLSPAYGGAAVTVGGPMNRSGQILAKVMIGRSPRLMRLAPVNACTANCTRVTVIAMTGKFINDPSAPGSCTPRASNHVVTTVSVKNEAGAPIAGVTVKGHIFDDYWMDKIVSGTTGTLGKVTFTYNGPACVGAIAFLVDGANKAGRTFDRSTGVLTNSVIPQ